MTAQESALATEAMAESVTLAIDLGGTWTRLGLVAGDGQLLRRIGFPTPRRKAPPAMVRLLATQVSEIRRSVDAPVLSLGVAAPGPLDPSTGTVLDAPNLPGWKNVPLAAELGRLTGLRVVVGNDANLAALGEVLCGAARGARDAVYLTISTGVGSGIYLDGRLIEGRRGAAAEAGHMAVSMDGPLCSCGNRGCLEAYASGTGLIRRAHDAINAGRRSMLQTYGERLTAMDVGVAAGQGDPLAQELLGEAGTALGFAIRNLARLFDPSIVVVGGGVSRVGPRLWEPMLRVVEEDSWDLYRKGLRVVPPGLGEDSGLVGAGLYARTGWESGLSSRPDPS